MTCWIYDLDGVVTHLTEKKITNPHLLGYFTKQLEQGDFVTINTGRGLPFVREQVLSPLLSHILSQNLPESLLHNFFIVGEKGNAWIEDEKDCFDMTTAVPEDFVKKVQALVEKDFADTMFYDNTKKTMVSTEIHTGLSLEQYKPSQQKLTEQLQNMLVEEKLDSEYHLDPTLSAVDVDHKTAGKAKGTKRILEWLKKRDVKPDKFVAFGDSKADLGTGEALKETGKSFDFVFVGDPDIISSHQTYPVIFTQKRYDEGVIEYLSGPSASSGLILNKN